MPSSQLVPPEETSSQASHQWTYMTLGKPMTQHEVWFRNDPSDDVYELSNLFYLDMMLFETEIKS